MAGHGSSRLAGCSSLIFPNSASSVVFHVNNGHCMGCFPPFSIDFLWKTCLRNVCSIMFHQPRPENEETGDRVVQPKESPGWFIENDPMLWFSSFSLEKMGEKWIGGPNFHVGYPLVLGGWHPARSGGPSAIRRASTAAKVVVEATESLDAGRDN